MARKNLLKGFKKPKGITYTPLETNPNYGKFTAYPFETGFGTTIGNTLKAMRSLPSGLRRTMPKVFRMSFQANSKRFRISRKTRWKLSTA